MCWLTDKNTSLRISPVLPGHQTPPHDIGGYLGLEEFMGKEYYPDLIALNTGRNALACLIHEKLSTGIYCADALNRFLKKCLCIVEDDSVVLFLQLSLI